MEKLTFNLTWTGNKITDPNPTTKMKDLNGGVGRYRNDLLNASQRVSVTWALEGDELDTFRAFIENELQGGGLPFLIDLPVDEPFATEKVAWLVPGTLSLDGSRGYLSFVSADLEVAWHEGDLDSDTQVIEIFETYNSNRDILEVLNRFETLVNIELPDRLP